MCTRAKIVQLMIQMMFLSFTRTGELLGAVWTEFDFEQIALAHSPRANEDEVAAHCSLSNQMLAVLRELREFFWRKCLLFPSEFKSAKTLNENTILNALAEMGYKGVQTGHGFRGLHQQSFMSVGLTPSTLNCNSLMQDGTRSQPHTTMRSTWSAEYR